MPIYEYVCMSCESHFEELVGMSDPDPVCPDCGNAKVAKQFPGLSLGEGPGCNTMGTCMRRYSVTPGIDRWRIDPTDIAVSTPINDVHPAAAAVLEHHAGGSGQIQFQHGLADGKPL